MNTKAKTATLAELKNLYPDAKPALKYSTPYELLVAVVLSAQCTDERVNKVTAVLFEKYSTPEAMLTLTQKELESYIFSCGFYRMKAEHILSASKDIVERFAGQVPNTIEALMTLAGVGKKTANVVYSVAFGGDAIAVDTHVFRVSNRLGLAKGKTPEEVEKGLNKAIPKSDWSKAHHWLIYHGRKVCHSQRPNCGSCTLNVFCDFYKHNNGNTEPIKK
ncbi:MAG: endonuclease III [Clostridia bacterium]|nr:endonuclease III [Clostridia bacterium]